MANRLEEQRQEESLIEQVANAGIITGTITLATSMFGLDGFANVAAYIAGYTGANAVEGKEITSTKLRNEGLSGLLMTPLFQVGWEAMEYVNPIGRLPDIHQQTQNLAETVNIAKSNRPSYAARTALIGGAYVPGVIATNQALDYVLDKRQILGVYDHVEENFWDVTKKVIWQVTPLIAINAILIPSGLNVVAGAIISGIYRVIYASATNEESPEKEPTIIQPQNDLQKPQYNQPQPYPVAA